MKIEIRQSINRKKKYYGILLSYLLIFVIPLLCGAMLHIYNKQMVMEQSADMTKRSLDGIRNQTDAYMERIWQMTMVASQLESVNALRNASPFETEDNAYRLYLVGKELETFYFDTALKDIFVYFRGIDRIAGRQGTLSPDLYAEAFFDKAISGEQLRETLRQFHYRECVKVPSVNGGTDILCIISDASAAGSGEPQYAAVAVIEEDALKKMLESARWTEETAVCIQDREGRSICQTDNFDGMDPAALYRELSQAEEDYTEVVWNKEAYAGMAMESAATKWNYIMLTPRKVIEENADQMQKFYFLSLFGCIFVGVAIAGVLSRKHYHPVRILQELIAQFKSQNENQEIQKGEDEYQWLQDQAALFFKERLNTMRILRQDRRELSNYYLLRLLENAYTEDLDQKLKENGISFPYSQFTVAQFVITDGEKNPEEQSLLYFIVKNIFVELMENAGGFTVYMLHAGDGMAAILNFDSRKGMEQIREAVYQAQELIEERFHHEITALLGGCYGSRSEIFRSYEDTREMVDYIPLLGETLIDCQDVRGREQTYQYNAELDQKLFQAVKAGKEEAAKEMISVVLKQHSPSSISLSAYRCMIFDILGTILKGADAGGIHELTEENEAMEKLSSRLSPDQMKEILYSLLEAVCGRIQEQQKPSRKNEGLIRHVQEYILENFRDPDLNISQTGIHFHMTPSYLSAIYKKETGTSLLEFINQARLDEAERLLEQGMTVAEVAEKAGFRDSTYLIRVFKKKRGVTPGQKKQNRK